eukprot:scaffold79343_cov18-Tisochrysis_lutea.AAC.1
MECNHPQAALHLDLRNSSADGTSPSQRGTSISGLKARGRAHGQGQPRNALGGGPTNTMKRTCKRDR